MIKTMVGQEILSNLKSLRLVLVSICTIALCPMVTLIGSMELSANLAEVERVKREVHDENKKTTVFKDLNPHVVFSPQPLHILSRGVIEGRGLIYEVEVSKYRRAVGRLGAGTNDDLMMVLARTDFAQIIGIVLSFLAVTLGFNSICGERERGTLRLLMSNPISRGQIVAAKLIGGIVSLIVPLFMGFLTALIVLLWNPDVVIQGDDWGRLALFFAISCLMLGTVFAFSMCVSAWSNNSAKSLIICLFAWLLGGVGYVNAMPAIARYGIDYPPFEEFLEQRRETRNEIRRNMATWEKNNPKPEGGYSLWLNQDGVVRFGHPQGYAWLEERSAYEFDEILEAADKVHQARWQNQRPLAVQEYTVDNWSILSPITNYITLSKFIARSSLSDMMYAAQKGIDYRDTYIQWLRARMAESGWRRWFTDDPPEQEPMIPNPESIDSASLAAGAEYMESRRTWANQQLTQAKRDPNRQLSLVGVPKFNHKWKRNLVESLPDMLPGLVTLILTFGVCLMITVYQFTRCDIQE